MTPEEIQKLRAEVDDMEHEVNQLWTAAAEARAIAQRADRNWKAARTAALAKMRGSES